jgi:hypothetical protein
MSNSQFNKKIKELKKVLDIHNALRHKTAITHRVININQDKQKQFLNRKSIKKGGMNNDKSRKSKKSKGG